MFQDKTTREFQCDYCPKLFSKLSSLRNHLHSHRDQMYLDETGLLCKGNTITSSQELNTSHEYNLFIESLNKEQDMLVDCWQEKVCEVSFYIEDNQLTTLIKIDMHNLIYYIQDNDNDIYGNNTNNTNILSNEWFNEDRNDVSNKNLNSSKNSSEKNSIEHSNDKDSYELPSEILTNDSEDYEVQNSIIIDVRSAQKVQETNIPIGSFPNLAYEAFVQLVTKHKLSDSTANDIIKLFNKFHLDPTATLPPNVKSARKLLDSMQIPHILYSKIVVLEEYTLYYRSIFDAIKELLSKEEIFKYCTFDYKPKYVTNNKGEVERCYSELYNCEWWGRAQSSINENAKVLSIILYSDATTCDMLGKTSEHPVFLTLGNIACWRRNKPDAKALLAYLPKIKASDQKSKHSLFHRSMEILVEPIKSGSIDLHTSNGILWCYPFLSVLLGDIPEHHEMTLTFNSPNCKMPCHICTTPKDRFNDPLTNDSTIQLRTPELMQYVLQNKMSEEYSLHNIDNPFWELS